MYQICSNSSAEMHSVELKHLRYTACWSNASLELMRSVISSQGFLNTPVLGRGGLSQAQVVTAVQVVIRSFEP